MNKLNKENGNRLIAAEQMTARWVEGGGGWRDWAKKEKALIDMDNSVVTAGGRAVWGG